MADRDPGWLTFHLLGPAQTIEANLGYRPRFVAYPTGKYDQLVIDSAHEIGYWGGLTTVFGAHQQKYALFELERIRVANDWSLEQFSAFMAGLQ